MLKDQQKLAEFFEVEELESRLETCWAGCAEVNGCCDACVNGACPPVNVNGVCPPIGGSNAGCGGGGGE